MSRKVVLVGLIATISLVMSAQARAAVDQAGSGGTTVTTTAPPTTVASVSNTGNGAVVDVGAGTPEGTESSSVGAGHPGSGPGSAAGPPPLAVCVWVNYDIQDPRAIASSGVKVVDHVTSVLQERVCDGQPTGTFRWWEILRMSR